tara:strand:- start:639 stop:1067 length:429 start_codon:yes stop_codon:yes gene_type:complete
MADFGIPAFSELLPSDIVVKMRQEGGSDWLNRADDLTQKAALGGLVLGGRQIPKADETARRVAALLERFGDEYLPEQLGIGGGGLTYTQPDYSLSVSPSSVGFQTNLLGAQVGAEIRTGSVKDMLRDAVGNLGFTARAKWEF